MPLDSPLVRRARELARIAHADHQRKAPKVPYFEHLEAVAHLLCEHGYDDDVLLAAAYLHDLLEDRPAYADQMRAEMPDDVIHTVEILTERKHDDDGRLRSKRSRFDDYVAGLRADTEVVARARPISCADKIHNTLSLVEAEKAGQALLMNLSTRPGEHEAQLSRLRDVYALSVNARLLETFDQAAQALLETIAAWLPGRAVMIAAEAHLGQFDKAGAPYVYHPLRLMLRAKSPEARMAAALHDVVEDSAWTLAELAREGFPPAVVRAVEHLTKRPDEPYAEFIERVARDRLATEVKLLDLEDNADLSRLPEPTAKDHARVERYREACDRLRAEQRKRSLWIVLDEVSAEALRRLACHPVVRADHVTLAHRIDPAAVAGGNLLPDGRQVGDSVEVRAVAEHRDARVQALVVEIGGSTRRPADDGTLHVTVSRVEGARSRHANELLERTEPRSIDPLTLRGRIEWVDR